MKPLDLGILAAHVAEARVTIEHVRDALLVAEELHLAHTGVRALRVINVLADALREAQALRVRALLRAADQPEGSCSASAAIDPRAS